MLSRSEWHVLHENKHVGANPEKGCSREKGYSGG